MTGCLAALDGAGQLDRTAEQQQLFGERGFAGVRVGNDGECSTQIDFLRSCGIGNCLGLIHLALRRYNRKIVSI